MNNDLVVNFTPDSEDVRFGISRAFWDWMQDHDITTQELIESGIQQAITAWLDRHSGEVLELIISRTTSDFRPEVRR